MRYFDKKGSNKLTLSKLGWPSKNVWSNWNLEILVFEEGEKHLSTRKTLEARIKTDNKLNLNMTQSPGIEPGPH